mmetsp:Transcript_14756/g.22373  ORF Transcript_14756/g.22373 Transcript_14756/m.22373 type:complete len:479 (+) Transcript_14756:147-1583(+)
MVFANLNMRNMITRETAGVFEITCIFFSAVGVSIGFTSVLAAVNYFAITLFQDRREFLYLCCAVYLPSLPVTMFQLRYDNYIDKQLGSRRSFAIRAAAYFVTMGLIMVYLPIGPAGRDVRAEPTWHRQPPLLISVTVLGFVAAFSYGTFFQIVSIIPSKNGAATAVFSMGYQGSGIIVMILSTLVGFRTNPTDFQVKAFFWCAALFEFFAGFSFFLMAVYSDVYNLAIARRDQEASVHSELDVSRQSPRVASELGQEMEVKVKVGTRTRNGFGVTIADSFVSPVSEASEADHLLKKGKKSPGRHRSDSRLSNAEILEIVAPSVLSIFLNIFASVFLLPFYTYFPTTWDKLPQMLFFTKLFSDTLGRPLTILFPIKNQMQILCLTFIRCAALAFFFTNILGLWRWETQTQLLAVGVFSASSGYVGTSAYQLAPSLVKGSFNKSQVANMLNFGFHLAVAVALFASTVVATVVDAELASNH